MSFVWKKNKYMEIFITKANNIITVVTNVKHLSGTMLKYVI